jgi:hypothetical protein
MSLERITVSANRHFLVTESGKPFFWLGDTAWELFHRLNREEARIYFANRSAHGFTVIQAVALAEMDGMHTPDPYGELPLVNDDPTQPNEAYFKRVDEYIQMAAEYGLYVGLLPTWGDKVNHQWGAGPVIFDAENAYTYGKFLGDRYRNQTNILWVLGGDRPAEHEGRDYRPIWRAMAQGIDDGSGQRVFKTYHPMGGHSTSAWLQNEDWLDMHMQQSGHGGGHDVPVWEWIARDYTLAPTRPVLDGEPNYEDHPVNPWPKWDPRNGYFRDYDVRKQLYRSVFAGGCGVTYGHHFIWQMYSPNRQPVNNGNEFIPWYDAIHRPGATQVKHLRALMESRPYLTRVPDQSLILSIGVGNDQSRGDSHVVATRDENGSNALIYLPRPLPVTVDVSKLSGEQLKAWWYNPVTGVASLIGTFSRQRELTLGPSGASPDWVLVLDDVAAGFQAPGM